MTPVNKTAGLVNSADSLRGRVFTTTLADCNNSADAEHWRKLKFQIDEIKGFDCYTNFHGMDITKDKLAALVERIRAEGDDPAEYVDVSIKVPERKFAAWPSHIRSAFEDARTVRTGRPSFRLSLTNEVTS